MHPYMFKPKTRFVSDPHASGRRNSESRPGALRLWFRAGLLNWQRRKMITTLEGLDDYVLHDIGISRSEIPTVVDNLTDRELGMRPIS